MIKNIGSIFILLIISISFSVKSEDISYKSLKLFSQLGFHIENVYDSYLISRVKDEYTTIRVGVISNDEPPYNITMNGSGLYYEGIAADYLNYIAQSLDLKVEILLFKNVEEAVEALDISKVDVLTSTHMHDLIQRVIVSQPYIASHFALYAKNYNIQPKSIAVHTDYFSKDKIEKLFPNAKVINYPTYFEAIESVVLDNTEGTIVDVLSANYLLKDLYKSLKLNSLVDVDNFEGYFYFDQSDFLLKEAFDVVLSSISDSEHRSIKNRWSNSFQAISEINHPFNFSEKEKGWLSKNKMIRVAINEFNAPVSYLDTNDVFNGFGADILDMVKIQLGVDIVIFPLKNTQDVEKALKENKVDIALLSPSPRRDEDFLFSKSFTSAYFTLVVSESEKRLTSKADIKSLVLPESNIVNDFIDILLPNTEIKLVSNYIDAMDMVDSGKADATILPTGVADYYIQRYFRNRLVVSKIFYDMPPIRISFAISKNQPELVSILDQVLSVISPDALQTTANRWRRNAVPGQENWRDYKNTIYAIGTSAVVLILASLVWAWVTRSHYLKRLHVTKALKYNLQFMQEVIDSIPHPIYVRNLDNNLVLCNESYKKLFNLSSAFSDEFKELSNMTLGIMRDVHQDYYNAIKSEKAIYEDKKLVINGKTTHIYHWFQPYRDHDGNIAGVVGGWVDVSDRIQLLEELTLAKDKADSASQAKTNFLATMSHEIRTPMNAIIGLLELAIKHSENGECDIESVQVAHTSARGLLELIGDILDVIKIESGRLDIVPKDIDIKKKITHIVQVFEGIAKQKGLKLTLEWDPELPSLVILDPLRIKQIVSNIVGNSIKFTEQGYIRISASKRLNNEGVEFLLLKISDTGSGIPENVKTEIFSPFVQAHDNNKGGTGLGLNICHSLCKLMGGNIFIDSEVGKGTSVEITLPLIRSVNEGMIQEEEEQASELSKSILTPKYLLIVDDHKVNRLLLSQQLTYLGHVVDEAASGEEALQKYAENTYHAVITDCTMPEMDGYELTQKLRQMEQVNLLHRAVILGYTANAQLDVKEACKQAGMDDCLFKPLSLDDLDRVLTMYFQEEEAGVVKESELDISDISQYFKPASLEQLLGGDKIIARQLLQELVTVNSTDLVQLTAMVKIGDSSEIRNIAHKIKGACRMIEATPLMEACERLERLEDIPESFIEVKIQVQCLTEEITRYLNMVTDK